MARLHPIGCTVRPTYDVPYRPSQCSAPIIFSLYPHLHMVRTYSTPYTHLQYTYELIRVAKAARLQLNARKKKPRCLDASRVIFLQPATAGTTGSSAQPSPARRVTLRWFAFVVTVSFGGVEWSGVATRLCGRPECAIDVLGSRSCAVRCGSERSLAVGTSQLLTLDGQETPVLSCVRVILHDPRATPAC